MDSVLKVVYSKWYTFNNNRYPFANGTSDKFAEWAQTQDLVPTGDFDRISALEDYYFFNNANSDYYFRNSNFYFHCKQQGMEFVSEDEIDSDIYVYPIEIECNTIHYVLRPQFLETLSDTILGHLKSGKVKLLFVNMVDPSIEPSIIKETQEFFNGIDIVFLQGNVRYDADATMLDSVLSLYQTANEMDRYPYPTALGYVSDYVRALDLVDVVRPKKFISFNRFMDRCHRTGLAYLALKYNLLDQGYFSFLYNNKQDYKDRLEQLDLPIDYAEQIESLIPCQIDTHHLINEELPTFFTVTNYRKDLYLNSYVHIVTETQFEQDASPFMSEKTWRPILNLQPFVYLGNPLALNTLRTMGFKTFSPFINEDYDNELDPKKRFALVEKEVAKLGKMSIDEIHQWYVSIKDVLIHNQNLLYSYKNYNPICQLQNIN
jgi:hypothetical protein